MNDENQPKRALDNASEKLAAIRRSKRELRGGAPEELEIEIEFEETPPRQRINPDLQDPNEGLELEGDNQDG